MGQTHSEDMEWDIIPTEVNQNKPLLHNNWSLIGS